ncbi:MAG: hypothetical protein LUD41_04240, partial [Phascolarctobacterium sp.]|nr:hypothetical protein [Phascolarctobacterium sp.]
QSLARQPISEKSESEKNQSEPLSLTLSQSLADGGQCIQRSDEDADKIACALGGIVQHLRIP